MHASHNVTYTKLYVLVDVTAHFVYLHVYLNTTAFQPKACLQKEHMQAWGKAVEV